MTVKQLIDKLKTDFYGTELVVIAKHAECNGFSPLAEPDGGYYCADSTYSGERVDAAAIDGAVAAVFLYPVN